MKGLQQGTADNILAPFWYLEVWENRRAVHQGEADSFHLFSVLRSTDVVSCGGRGSFVNVIVT